VDFVKGLIYRNAASELAASSENAPIEAESLD
jgi:hypothetical protein